MALVRIETLDDPRLESYRNLKDTNRTRWSQTFIAEGDKLVERLLQSRFDVASVLLGERYVDAFLHRLPAEVPVYAIPDALVDELVGFNFHRGILACGRRNENPPLDQLLTPAAGRLTLVVCPGVQDPENLGSMFRISSALGVDAILLGGKCCDPFSRRVLRVSMGSVLRLPFRQATDLAAELDALRDDWNVEVAATVLDPTAEPLDTATRSDRLALLFGNEGQGLEQHWVEKCDRRLTIPMALGVDSLNVAVATGVFLYHFTRESAYVRS